MVIKCGTCPELALSWLRIFLRGTRVVGRKGTTWESICAMNSNAETISLSATGVAVGQNRFFLAIGFSSCGSGTNPWCDWLGPRYVVSTGGSPIGTNN
jgi:hypothetical protein